MKYHKLNHSQINTWVTGALAPGSPLKIGPAGSEYLGMPGGNPSWLG